MHLTVDTNILDKGFIEFSTHHLLVLYAIASTRKVICVDSGGQITREYRNKLSGRENFEKWYKEVVLDSRYRGQLAPRHANELTKLGCHQQSDHIFIAVAYESSDKILLTEDSDMGKGPKGQEEYHKKALDYLLNTVGIRVYDASEARDLLGIR